MFALRALRVGLGPAVYGALRATQAPTAIGRLAALRSFSSSAPAMLATAAKKTTTAAAKRKTTTTTTKKPAAKKTTTKKKTAAAKRPARRVAAKKTTKTAKKKVDGRAAAARRRTRARLAARTPEQRAEARKAARAKAQRAELRALPKPPKRVPTPFALYIKQHPAAGHGPAYLRARSAEWAALPAAERAQYSAQCDALRPLYRAEYERWAKALPPLALFRLNADLRRRGKARLPPPPVAQADKAPLQPFMRFFADFRATADPALAFGERGRAAGAAWRALSDAEKRPYIESFEADRAAYKARKNAQA